MAEVVTLTGEAFERPKADLVSEIPGCLRALADKIESGEIVATGYVGAVICSEGIIVQRLSLSSLEATGLLDVAKRAVM